MFGKKAQRIQELETLVGQLYNVSQVMAYDLGIHNTAAWSGIREAALSAANRLEIYDTDMTNFSVHNIRMDHAKLENPWGHHAMIDGSAGEKAHITNGASIGSFSRGLVMALGMELVGVPSIAQHDKGYKMTYRSGMCTINGNFIDASGDFYIDILMHQSFDLNNVQEYIRSFFKPKNMSTQFIFRQSPHGE